MTFREFQLQKLSLHLLPFFLGSLLQGLRGPPFTLPSSNDSSFMPPTFPPANVPRLDLPADENVDLEELEQFAKEFKQRRIKLGN